MKQPFAFLSYVRLDDAHEEGRLTKLRERLSGEVKMQTGREFPIFQDRNDIRWGQSWQHVINQALDEIAFFIPIITPSFFQSPACREELTRFMEREESLNRNDLILPIYYVECDEIQENALRNADPLAKLIANRNFADWRELRFEPLEGTTGGKAIAQIGREIKLAVRSRETAQPMTIRSNHREDGPQGETSGSRVNSEGKILTLTSIKEPPILVVDPMHRGDYPTISEAIKKAAPGTRILVRPGLYEEGLIIDKPLEILGDGPREEIEIRAVGQDAVFFKTTMGRIENLMLRQAGGGDWYGVDITQGRLHLENCDVRSDSFACVAIHGQADPIVRNNVIHHGKSSGIYVYQNGRGTIEDNDVHEHSLAGIAIKQGADPVVRKNRVHDVKGSGIYIYDEGRGTIEDNDVYGNSFSGIAIRAGGDPIVRRNTIRNGKQAGINIYQHGCGLIEDNNILDNAFSGIISKENGEPIVTGNRISRNREGIRIIKEGRGVFKENILSDNRRKNVDIAPDCKDLVTLESNEETS